MKYLDMKTALERDEVRERSEEINGEQFNIVCYMVATPDLWDVENAVEARGITFNDKGDCVCRTMPKFFNINENKHTQLHELDFNGAVAFDKLDGSMVTPVRLKDGTLRLKTKKSFYSDVALNAQRHFEVNPKLNDLVNHLLDNGITPTFEFESPDSQIVIEQTENKMTLLLARHIETGQDVPFYSLVDVAAMYGVPIVNSYEGSDINSYIERAKTEEGIEGWVFLLKSGQRVKLKTDWYLARHRLTNYHERNIFDLVINEEIDDLMPLLEQKSGAVETVNEVGHRIARLFKEAERHATEMVNYWKSNNLALPEIGKGFSQDKHFSLAIKLFKGQEPDFKKFVVNHHRDEFHTRPLFFGFDTDA